MERRGVFAQRADRFRSMRMTSRDFVGQMKPIQSTMLL